MDRMERRERLALAAFVSFAAVVYATYSVVRHEAYHSAGFDLGIFDQAMRGYAGFGAPDVSLREGANLLGDHFHPILVVLTPLYWLWDDPRTLLLAQAALIASSIVPVYLMARRLDRWVAGGIAVAYAFGWPVQAMLDHDFHEVAFALPLLAWTIYYVDRERYGAAVLTSLSLLLVREDMGLVLVALAVVLLVKRRWVEAAITGVAGLGVFYVVTAVIVPALAPELGNQYWTYEALGKDLPSALRFVVTNPLRTLRIFTEGVKARTISLLLVQHGFVCLLSPYVLLAVPLAAGRFFSSRPLLWYPEFHYNAPIAVILMLALVDVLRRAGRASALVPRIVAGLVALLTVAGTLYGPDVYGLYHLPRFAHQLDNARVRAARAAVAEVPAGVCVEADDRLVPHLTTTNDVAIPGLSGGRASWLVLDLAQSYVGGNEQHAPGPFFTRALDEHWDVVARHRQFWVLHRPGTDARDCFPD